MDTVNYSYGNAEWGDLLTHCDERSFYYDAIGNLLSDSMWSYTWEQGRRLKNMSRNGMTWNFTYGPDGMRTSRSNGTTTWKYTYNGSQLMAMTNGSTKMYFTYDAAGRPVSIEYNGTTYYYVLNVQGDVVTIVNSSGSPVVNYTYNAWGKLCRTTGSMASTLGIYNPLRYRGYVYDTDTGLYYLQSRYYNPEMGRFINADGQLSTGDLMGSNLFAYCGNNPVNCIDPTGEAWYHWAIGAAIVVGFAALTVATCGGSLALAAASVGLVASGLAAGTTATTVAAAAFVGAATMYGMSAVAAAVVSSNADEFAAQGSWITVASTLTSGIAYGFLAYTPQINSTVSQQPTHLSGLGSPKNNPNPNGSYTQLDTCGNIKSYAQYNSQGNQILRIDFQGRPHAGVLPHIHLYTYPEQGGRCEYTFDLMWNLIN